MPFRDRVARRFGETVSFPASLSPSHPVSPNHSADPRVGTGSGLGLGCNRNRATVRHDRRDDTRNSSRSNEGEKVVRKVLGVKHLHYYNKIVKTSKPWARRAGRRISATTGRSCSSVSRRSAFRSPLSSNPLSARNLYGRATRASSRLTDENGKQLSPTAPYLSCKYPKYPKLLPRSHHRVTTC